MDDDDNWDLNAVVRSCRVVTQTTTAAAATNPIMTGPEEDESFWDWLKPEEVNDPLVSFPSDLLEPGANAFQELQQFYEPFFPNPTTTNNPPTTKSYAAPIIPNSSTISDFGGSAAATSGLQQQHHAQVQQQHQFVPTNNNPIIRPIGYQYHQQPLLLPKPENQILLSHHQPPPGFIGRPSGEPGPMPIMPAPGPLPRFPYTATVPYHTPRTRKKKCQQKREVVEVSAENLSADLWAWRKYGQKPIKGSPHPRNYYRCSSSKGCGARKQVERSVKDPEIFVVTYTGEHTHPRPTHRNSLAGSTRNRLSSTTTSQTQPIINDGSSSTPPTVPSPTEQLADQDAALVNDVNSSGNMLGKEIDDEELEDGEDVEMDEDDVMMRDVAAEEEEEDDMFMGQNKQVGYTSSSSGSAGSSWASANHFSSAGATVGGDY